MNTCIYILSCLLLIVAACAPRQTSAPPVLNISLTGTVALAKTAASSLTPLPSTTPSFTPQPTETPVPSYAILRGEVLERSNCRYGPGAPYIYKYGLLKGNRLEVIGRSEAGTWVYVQAIGGHNPCWVKASLMDIQGEVMRLEPVYPLKAPLPRSPYYPPPTGVLATRSGIEVEVSWNDVPLRAGDEEGNHYLVEAWLCQGGQLLFTPIGTDDLAVILTDEPGCLQPSHGWVYTQEKHGYSPGAEIRWPPLPAP